MRSYATRPTGVFHVVDSDGHGSMTADTVIVEEPDLRPTGLLNAQGERLYRVRETVPFGFRAKG